MLGAVDRLVPFVDSFSTFFHTRSDHNPQSVRDYLFGLLQAKRGSKNMERMEEHVPGFDYQRVQHRLSHSPWEHRPLMDEIARQADGLLGGASRTRLVIDDTGFEKKGRHSVGVARQYNGRLGKVDNCQVAVCTSLASGQWSTLVDARLYLPKEWTDEPARCDAAGIPQDQQVYQSKAAMALQSVRHQRSLGVRFASVSMDSGYGSQPELLHGLDADGETFVAELHCDAHIWESAPWLHQQSKRPGTKLKHPRPSQPSMRVDQWAQAQAPSDWRRLKVRDSAQGWVEVNYLSTRIWQTHGEEEKLWWLLVWENPDETRSKDKQGHPLAPRRHYALTNAPADADVRRLVADGVERNVIEINFRDAKSEVGMADYQARGWTAWHHHMALVMLAMLFLQRERMHHTPPANAPELTSGDIVFVIERLLPQRGYGRADLNEVKTMLGERLRKRELDQRRRKTMAQQCRSKLWPDEFRPSD